MIKLQKVHREFKRRVEALGLKVVGWDVNGKTHYRFRILYPQGFEKTVIMANSPSCHRAMQNNLAEIKRAMVA